MWDDALLYQVAVDPFQQTAISGKEDGRAAGLNDGYFEGVTIGRSKGWEVGLELGYIYEFSREIVVESRKELTSSHEALDHNLPQNQDCGMQSHRWRRCIQLANDLTHMIDEFPDPDALLCVEKNSEHASTDESNKKQNAEQTLDDGASGTNYEHSSESCATCNDKVQEAETHHFLGKTNSTKDPTAAEVASKLDISSPLERIRARFKLLCTLLKTKQSFDLKNVLEVGNKITAAIKDNPDGVDQISEQIESRRSEIICSTSSAGDTSVLDSDW